PGCPRIKNVQPFNKRNAVRDGLPVILRKVSYADFVSPGHLSGIDREYLVRGIDKPRCIPNQRFQKGGFPGAVSSNQGDLFSAAHGGNEIVEDAELSGCAIV